MAKSPLPDGLRRVLISALSKVYARLETSHREHRFQNLQRCGTVQVGIGSYGTPMVYDLQGKFRHRVTIGNYCSIGPQVVLMLGGEHRTDFVSSFPFQNFLDGPLPHADEQPFVRGDINIGHDVWIGHGVFISSGVTIGTGAVIGAGSVVRTSVAPYEIVRGNPCRPLRKRFPEEHIAELLESRWWEWPVEQIRANLDLISSPNVTEFLERVHNRVGHEARK